MELSGNIVQPHFDRLRAEIGRYPRIEDLFFLNFKVEIDPGLLRNREDDNLKSELKKQKGKFLANCDFKTGNKFKEHKIILFFKRK